MSRVVLQGGGRGSEGGGVNRDTAVKNAEDFIPKTDNDVKIEMR